MKVVRKIRESTKEFLYDKALTNGIDFTQIIEAVPGKATLINLFVKNPLDRDEIYKVYIDDSDGIEYQSEISLVNNLEGEWAFWLDNSSHRTRPDDLGVVSKYNDFILKPYQALPLIFKFLTFRLSKVSPQVLRAISLSKSLSKSRGRYGKSVERSQSKEKV
jgi:hypothetical protein